MRGHRAGAGRRRRDDRGDRWRNVEYRLTPLGEEIAERVAGLVGLLESRMPDITAAQARYDAR
ncbi:hypothetical protein [Rhodococcus spongiicola]|uniref:hypothetical protein n=1 Tax=Rhodococcus spongiicola TaxID=2487352 RepID=UPI001F1A94C0|nr:hypothetical protein [Rhodococcus spongiicola]